MLSPIRLVFIFLMVYFAKNIDHTEGRNVYERHWSFPKTFDFSFDPESEYISGHNVHNYTKITYSACEPLYSKNMTEVKCTIVQETEPRRSCSTKRMLTPNKNRTDEATIPYYILPFSSTKSLIVWIDISYDPIRFEHHRVSVLDFTTCHQSEEVFLKPNFILTAGIKIIAYGDSFDLVIQCGKKNFKRNKYCKYNVNDKGEIVSKTEPWFAADDMYVSNIYGIVADSKLKGYVRTMLSPGEPHDAVGNDTIIKTTTHRSVLTKSDGSSKLLVDTQVKYKKSSIDTSSASTAYETISIAINNGTHINVWQFDQEGNFKSNTLIGYKINLVRFRISNLADGGFLLLTVHCDENCEKEESSQKYYLIKVDANGKIIGSIEDVGAEFDCQRYNPSLQILQNKENEYCTVVQCKDFASLNGNTYNADYLMKCYTDKDFSVSTTLF